MIEVIRPRTSVSAAFLCMLFSPALALAGASVPGGEVNPDATDIPPLRPPRAEIPPGFWEQYGIWFIFGAILFFGAVACLTWYLKKARPAVVEPPERKAREALQLLSNEAENGVVLSRISQVLRHYFAAAFNMAEGELTTAEFSREIQSQEVLGAELRMGVVDFLRVCDERKFSAASADAPLTAAAKALEFVDMAEARRARATRPGAEGSGLAK